MVESMFDDQDDAFQLTSKLEAGKTSAVKKKDAQTETDQTTFYAPDVEVALTKVAAYSSFVS